jgi:hypothetical protein
VIEDLVDVSWIATGKRQLTHYLDTGDIDFQHTTGVGSRHNLIWGAGYRADRDVTFASQVISFEPATCVYP